MTPTPDPTDHDHSAHPDVHRFHDEGTTLLVADNETDGRRSLVGMFTTLDPTIARELKPDNRDFLMNIAFVWFGEDDISLCVDGFLFSIPMKDEESGDGPRPFSPDVLTRFLFGLSADDLSGLAIIGRVVRKHREESGDERPEPPLLRVTVSPSANGDQGRIELLRSLYYFGATFRMDETEVAEGILRLALDDGSVVVQEWCDTEHDWSGRLVLLPVTTFDRIELI